MIFVGTRVIPRVMAYIASWNSRELFLLAITAIGLGIGYGTYLFGLSFAFGAFVAGMVLSESDYGHQALSDIIPVRDLFGLLFFVSVGMLLEPHFLMAHWHTILLAVLLVSVGKGLIFSTLSRIFGYGNVVPLAVGLGLFQVGEFSFVLARVGVSTNSISDNLYSLILTTAIATMILTPLVSGLTAPLYAVRKKWFKREPLQSINLPLSGVQDHVIIAGGGRVGQYVAHVLHRLDLDFVIIEMDYYRVIQVKDKGFPVIYGDASQEIVLNAAGVDDACLVLVTTPSIIDNTNIVTQVRNANKTVSIVARAEGIEQMRTLHDYGVLEVVQPEFEAGLEITRQALLHLRIPPTEIQRFTDTIRRELYAPLYNTNQEYKTIVQLRHASHLLELSWIRLTPGSPFIGRSIQDLRIRSETGVSVVGVMRDGTVLPNPPVDYRFAAGDFVAIMGNTTQLTAFHTLFSPETGNTPS
jgi:CPA2 family monovalent cation:H+ antiporter-2